MVDLDGDNATQIAGPKSMESGKFSPSELLFGDNDQISMRWNSDSNRLEISGDVHIVDGDFRAGYDTNNITHDLILLGMDPNSTDAVGVQDNVIGWAHEWLDVSYPPITGKGDISNVFQAAPGDWVSWTQASDYPVQVTIRGLDDDWGPGRAVANFEKTKHPERLTFETRSSDGSWELKDDVKNNRRDVVVLDAGGGTKPVNDIRFTFYNPRVENEIVLDKLYYFSMHLEGQTWLSKVNDEAIGVTYRRQQEPPAPSQGWTVFTDEADGNLKAKKPDGTVVTLAD